MTLTDREIEDLQAAYKAGELIAKAYKVGETFLGAWGECDRLGYDAGSLQRRFFTIAYCANLKRPIVTTAEGVITQYG